MPIYEFYCPECHMIFSFFSRRINTEKRPNCPKCNHPDLERKPSLFSISKGRTQEDEANFPNLDEQKLEQAMMSLAAEAEHLDEDDPRQAAVLMKKLLDTTGLDIGPGMEEAIKRMEAGEDPEKIEEELGDLLEGEDPFSQVIAKKGVKKFRKTYLPPQVDPNLYEL